MATNGDEQNIEFWIQIEHYDDKCFHYNWLRFVAEAAGEEMSMVIFEDSAKSEAYLHKWFVEGAVTLDKFMYVVGRSAEGKTEKRPSKEIYRLNTRDFKQGWDIVNVELKNEVIFLEIAELDGKFYIFPRNLVLNFQVYDPSAGTVIILPLEENHKRDLVFLGVDRESKRIVFCSEETGRRYFYYPNEDNNKWEQKGTPENKDFVRDMLRLKFFAHTTHRETFCWIEGRCLLSYDFVNNLFSAPVHLSFISSYEAVMSSSPPTIFLDGPDRLISYLFHMSGDRCCLFWYKEQYIHHESYLSCTILRISNRYENGDFFLDVKELSTHTYKIPAPGFNIRHIVPVHMNRSTTRPFQQPEGTILLNRSTTPPPKCPIFLNPKPRDRTG